MFKIKTKKQNKVQSCFEYLLNGKRHREDGPALEWENGSKEWWVNGKRHRLDGPAVELANHGLKIWYIDGVERRHGGIMV